MFFFFAKNIRNWFASVRKTGTIVNRLANVKDRNSARLNIETLETRLVPTISIVPGNLAAMYQSADTISQTYEPLPNIQILENSATTDIKPPSGTSGSGTIILTAPTGRSFNTSSAAPTMINSYVGNVTSPSNTTAITGTVTSSTITFTITVNNATAKQDILTISGVQVKANSGSIASSPAGNIVESGTAILTGVSGSQNFGTLTEVAGAKTHLGFTNETGNANTSNVYGNNLTGLTKVAIQDQFGNTVTTDSTTVITLVDHASSSTPFYGTYFVTAASGVASFPSSSWTIGKVGSNYKIDATDTVGLTTATGTYTHTITARSVTISPAAFTKTYDGTTAATGATLTVLPSSLHGIRLTSSKFSTIRTSDPARRSASRAAAPSRRLLRRYQQLLNRCGRVYL